LRQLGQELRQQGRVSQPWLLFLEQNEAIAQSLSNSWVQLNNLFAESEFLQSGWFNFDLPPKEPFTTEYLQQRQKMTQTLLISQFLAKATGAAYSSSKIEQSQQQRSRFYQVLEAQGRSRPIVSQIHQREGGLSDREFARQRLAGQNPMVIRSLQSADTAHLATWDTQPHRIAGKAIDLGEAAAENRLFIADYPQLRNLTAAEMQPGRYVDSPIALFYRADTGLEPVLIQLKSGSIMRPPQMGEAADTWMRAKLTVQCADVTHHELISHLGETHLAMEAFAIATARQLPQNHPLYRLLHPHFRFLLAINQRGNQLLISEGAAMEKLLAPTLTASIQLINDAYRNRSFESYALPTNLKQRGVESATVLPDFPYREDAQLIWQAIAHYVTQFLQRDYLDDASIQADRYLQAWAAELGCPPQAHQFPQMPSWLPTDLLTTIGLDLQDLPAHPRVPDFPNAQNPGQFTHLQQLIEVATQLIFTCTAQHAAVNFSQFDYVGYTPNAPMALYSQPETNPTIAEFLPPPAQDLAQMELAFALSGIRWSHLGEARWMGFKNGSDRQLLQSFQQELADAERQINTRNLQRIAHWGVDYPYLLPSRIPNSINI
jgi:arachidonate 15-lipoxygenase